MKKYRIVRIDEPDFGCEGRPEGLLAMDKVYLTDEEGKELVIEAPDEWLYKVNLDEGDTVFYNEETGLMRKAE